MLQFDSTWDSGEPLVLAGLQVPPAFTQGLVGMKVGGLRRLVVPHELGYGPIGRGGVLPYETLVFMVELLDVTEPLTSVAGQPCVAPTDIPPVEGKPVVSYGPARPPPSWPSPTSWRAPATRSPRRARSR